MTFWRVGRGSRKTVAAGVPCNACPGLHPAPAASLHSSDTNGLAWHVLACCADPQVEKELSEICASILQLLDEHLIPTASTGESKVFYLKMKGDYHRYLAEFKTGADRKEAAEHTLLAYKAAQVSMAAATAAGQGQAAGSRAGALA